MANIMEPIPAPNNAAANKTLPLSIFEMQFYQGDFILQQQQQQQ